MSQEWLFTWHTNTKMEPSRTLRTSEDHFLQRTLMVFTQSHIFIQVKPRRPMSDGCLFTKYWRACEQYNRGACAHIRVLLSNASVILERWGGSNCGSCMYLQYSPPSPPVCVSVYPLLCPVRSPLSPPVCPLVGSLGVDMFQTPRRACEQYN